VTDRARTAAAIAAATLLFALPLAYFIWRATRY
jgi:ABC-type spermidine/putrescine transport system permease subunit I